MQTCFKTKIYVSFLIIVLLSSVGAAEADGPKSTNKPALFDHENLVAWCIVPFDSKNRGPEERAAMLEKIGVKQLAYDYRAEHIPTFDAEMEALKRHGINLTAWWFPGFLNDEAKLILEVLKRHEIKTQLWVTGGGGPVASEEERKQRIEAEIKRLRPIAEAAAEIGCQVALYNHGHWFGNPENQIAIIRQLNMSNVGIVYNLHHGHEHLDHFDKLLEKMKPYLLAINLNGMARHGDRVGKKILPLGAGELDLKLLKIIRNSGWRGPIGILNHTDHDAEARLQDNLDGLDWLVGRLDGGNVGARPKYRTYESPKRKFEFALKGGLVVKGKAEYRQPSITVDCRVRLTKQSDYNILVASDTKQSGAHWEIFGAAGSGTLAAYLPGKKPELISSTVKIVDDKWHHVAMIYEADRVRLVVDGNLAADTPVESTGKPTVAGNLAFGRLVEGGLACFGEIQYVRIRRGAQKIGKPLQQPPAADDSTLGLWKFDNLDKSSLEDQVNVSQTQQVLPFPENRVRDFYFHQAQRQLDSKQPPPQFYPEFPGLDGGAFGHWGQNPEAVNFDYTLNEVDVGGVVSQIVHHFGKTTPKGVAVRVGDDGQFTALFDPERLTFANIWKGGVTWGAGRFGLFAGIKPAGEQVLDLAASEWSLPADTTTEYVGFYRNAKRVVFVYQIGSATIYDSLWMNNGKVVRSRSIDGTLPQGAKLNSPLSPTFDKGQTKALARAGPALWADRSVSTHGTLGRGDGPYVIDTLSVPYGNQNPFNTPMRIGGLGFLPDGRAAVCTLMGDVWLVDGIDADLKQLRWTRFAAGLHQPLGLIVRDGKILVAGRDQITRLHDLNHDGEADFYECVSNNFQTGTGHDFLTSLFDDQSGALYFYSPVTGVAKLAEQGGPLETLATGLRNSNGMGVSPDGKIVLTTTQEGSWTPTTGIFEVGGASYHGFNGPKAAAGKYGYQMPLCFVPRGIDNSAGGLLFTPSDPRWGSLAGSLIGTSFGNCSHYVVLREAFEGKVQGGVVPLPGDFLSGAHRLAFNPNDGQLYVVGTDGWQSYAQENGSLQRVRYVGGQMPLPTAVETRENGLLVRFNCEVDPDSVDLKNIFCQQWNYLYSKAYGSPEFSVRSPGRRGHDPVEVQSVHLLDAGRSVFVEIPHLHSVMQFHLHMRLATSEGKAFSPDVYYSIFHQRKPFTDFPGYQPIERKKRYPEFPIAEQYPRDERLVAQETLGKSQDVIALEIEVAPGLRFEPRRLRVPPGKRIAITLKNTDASMPHNFVLTTPERLKPIGEAAMLLAADPRAIAKHYVPIDPGVLAFSPILWPNEQYTIYFDSPQEKGAYPFACSFPGHWQVMRGTLHVADPSDELPPEPETVERVFVKDWKLDDLVADAEQLTSRSFARGAESFQVAGCIKCHKINCVGMQLGPDLTEVNKRFTGAKLLQHILQPSIEINKNFQTYLVVDTSGKATTGLLLREDEQSLHLLTNPLLPDEVTTISKEDIEETEISKQSTMPAGLLMTLSREEILDLLAFIQAGGDPKHDFFQP